MTATVTGYTTSDGFIAYLFMSIRKIIVFVLLALLTYIGVYTAVFGLRQYSLYSGAERNMDYMSANELQPKLIVAGHTQTVTRKLYSDEVHNEIFGIPVGNSKERCYYVMPLGYEEKSENQKDCVIAATDPNDIEEIDKLLKNDPQPNDPNTPGFEFRGVIMDMSDAIFQLFRDYLWEVYDTDFNIYSHKNVSDNLVQYTIFLSSDTADNYIVLIIAGGVCAVVGVALFVLLAVRTYRKKTLL